MANIPAISNHDFSMYYHGCYVALPQSTGGLIPFYVDGHKNYDDDEAEEGLLGDIKVVGTVFTPTRGWVPSQAMWSEVDHRWPICGMINHKNFSVYVERQLHKQYRKALNIDLIQLHFMDSFAHRKVFELPMPHVSNSEFIYDLFNPKYMSPQKALELVATAEKQSIAINPDYAFFISKDAPVPLVKYQDLEIGWAKDGVVNLPTGMHHFYEDLSQYINCQKV